MKVLKRMLMKKMMQRRTYKRTMMLQTRKKKSLMEVMALPLLFAMPIVPRMISLVGSTSGNALIQFLVGMTLNLYHQLLRWALSVNKNVMHAHSQTWIVGMNAMSVSPHISTNHEEQKFK